MSSIIRARNLPNGFTDTRYRDDSVLDHSTHKALTISWQDIPSWMKDNEYILSGYRREQGSWSGCFSSVFGYLHNETINIHTHLWGAALFVCLSFAFYSTYITQYDSATWKDSAVFAIFLLSAVFCLTCSALFHVSTCHSYPVCARCHTFDYSGIVVLTVGSFFPCIYYGFFCEPVYQFVYLSAISLAGTVAAYIVLDPEYAQPSHRHARTNVFIALGLCGAAPVLHGLVSHGYRKLCYEMGFVFLLLSGVMYIFGALMYANRVPERFGPGKFDFFFASHQIFHVCVVLAALSHYICILTAFNHWHGAGGAVACMAAA